MSGVSIVASRVSSNVLKMNFMKKTAMKIEEQEKAKKMPLMKEEESDYKSRVYPTVETINDEPTCSIGSIFNEERFTLLEDLRFGRFSYNGQNPEIEKCMVYHECKRLGLELPEEEENSLAHLNGMGDEGELNDSSGEDDTKVDIKHNRFPLSTGRAGATAMQKKASRNQSTIKPTKFGQSKNCKSNNPDGASQLPLNPLYMFSRKRQRSGPNNKNANTHNTGKEEPAGRYHVQNNGASKKKKQKRR